MIVKHQKLKRLLDHIGLGSGEFASALGVETDEVDKLLSGIAVDYDTAKKFIYWMKAYAAQHYIDWQRMNIRNPLKEIAQEIDFNEPDDDETDDMDCIYDDFDSAIYYDENGDEEV